MDAPTERGSPDVASTFLHALHGNEIVLSDETRDEIEGWIGRFEAASYRMEESAGRMAEAAENHNRAVTRERTGG